MISEEVLVEKLKMRQKKRKTLIAVLFCIVVFLLIPSTIWTIYQHDHANAKLLNAIELISSTSDREQFAVLIESVSHLLMFLQTLKINLVVFSLMLGFLMGFIFVLIRGEDKTRLIIKLWDKIENYK